MQATRQTFEKGYVANNLMKGETVTYRAKLHWILLISFKAFFTFFIAPLIEMETTEIAITNKRIILKAGWISLKTMEYNIDKVEAINVNQGIWGKIFGYGSIVIVGTGGTPEVINFVENPVQFRNAFQALNA